MSKGGRKSLVWDIRKGLLTLTAEELFRVARAGCGPVRAYGGRSRGIL